MRYTAIFLIMMLGLVVIGSCSEKATEDVTMISLKMKGANLENIVYKLDGKSVTEEELFQGLSERVEQDASHPVRINAGPTVSAHFATHISERVLALGFTDVQIGK